MVPVRATFTLLNKDTGWGDNMIFFKQGTTPEDTLIEWQRLLNQMAQKIVELEAKVKALETLHGI